MSTALCECLPFFIELLSRKCLNEFQLVLLNCKSILVSNAVAVVEAVSVLSTLSSDVILVSTLFTELVRVSDGLHDEY